MDETLNPRLGGFMSMVHDADPFLPPLCVFLFPVSTVVGTIQAAPVAAAASAADLSGIAGAGNTAAIALTKNAKRPQFTRRTRDWVFFKRDWCNYVLQLGGKQQLVRTIWCNFWSWHQMRPDSTIFNTEFRRVN